MTFSIIIPAYNAEAFLPRCLDSIFSQDFSDYEVLVTDDGSTDSTPAILEKYAAVHPNMHVLTQSNRGMATARNWGLEEATGDYVLFVDSDDELMPHALSTLAPHLDGTDIIGFGTRIYNEQTNSASNFPLSTFHFPLPTGWDYFNLHRLQATPVHFVCIWQRAYRRAFLEEHHLRFVDGLRRAEDDLFSTTAFLHATSVKDIADILYIYHVRPTSITRSSDPTLNTDALRAQNILADTFIPMQGIDKTAIYQVLASNYINHLSHKGNTLTATDWRHFREACITPRHRRLCRLARISPSLMRLYFNLCSSLR